MAVIITACNTRVSILQDGQQDMHKKKIALFPIGDLELGKTIIHHWTNSNGIETSLYELVQ